mgnify:CR=1 FL=1
MTRDNVAPGLEFVTLKRAVQITGMDDQEVLDLAAIGEIRAGIIVPGLAGHAVPRYEGAEVAVCDGHHDLDGKFVRTRYHVQPKGQQEAHVVDVFHACGFWEIGGHAAEAVRTDQPPPINFLWPHEGADLSGVEPFMPWDESGVMLETPHTITRADLRFVTVDVERVIRKGGTGAHAGEMPDMQPAGRWPWGDHETELLRDLAAAASRFWGANYDPDEPDSADTNETVSEWLQAERRVSKRNADAIARILRPDHLPNGPRK